MVDAAACCKIDHANAHTVSHLEVEQRHGQDRPPGSPHDHGINPKHESQFSKHTWRLERSGFTELLTEAKATQQGQNPNGYTITSILCSHNHKSRALHMCTQSRTLYTPRLMDGRVGLHKHLATKALSCTSTLLHKQP